MTTITRRSGITVSIEGAARVEPEPARAARRKRGAEPAALPASPARLALARALADQSFEVADAVVVAQPTTPARRRRGAAASASRLTLDVPVAKGEQAVVLIEDDGEYRWLTRPRGDTATKQKRGARALAQRTLRFRIDLTASPPKRPRRGVSSKKRGLVGDWVGGKAVAYVLRFAVKAAGSKVVEYLERDVSEGLVAIRSTKLESWRILDDGVAWPARLPSNRPARVLLFLHGTFSSTVGSFGALCGTREGRKFLKDALAAYDVVVGYDHRTLSIDPRENAVRLRERLARVSWPQPPRIDVIAYSRGGLVARSWIEDLLPKARPAVQIGPAVFVGATNGGTQLAEPANWNRFADHYTTLALAATRIASLIPGTQVATTIASSAIRGVGVLVKALARGVITEKLAPGLAAMEPDGDFVTALNQPHPGRGAADAAPYYAITSNFEPARALAGGTASELPRKLLMRIVDAAADDLYRESNDLVVHVRAMTQLAQEGGTSIKTKLDYQTNGTVYHLNYFTQPETAAHLGDWLLGAADEARRQRQQQQQQLQQQGSERESKLFVFGEARSEFGLESTVEDLELEARPQDRPARGRVRPGLRGPGRSTRVKRRRKLAKGPGARPSFPGTPAGGGSEPKRSAKRKRKNGGSGAPTRKRARAGSDPLTCFFRGEMPPEVALEKRATLRVDISLEELLATAGAISRSKSAQIERAKKLIVEIAALRNLKVIGKRREEVDAPEPGAPRSVAFRVQGTHLGGGEVSVQVRQGSSPLVTLELAPRIVRQVRPKTEPMETSAESDQLGAPSEELDELRIIEQINGDAVTYLFMLDLRSLGICEEFVSAALEEGRDDYIIRVLNEIGDAWAAADPGARESFERNLRSIGGSMFDQLIPPRMQDLLWRNRGRIRAVQVFSREPFIPWELVYLKDPTRDTIPPDSVFLGELGLLRWLYKGYPPTSLRVRKGRARYVIAEYEDPQLELEKSADEEKMLKRTLGATRLPAVLNEVERALEKPGSFDLLHYCGHGEAAGTESTQAKLLISDDAALQATTVAQTAEFDPDHRPIVVLNACESARRNREFTGMGGFADAFVKRGVGLFIGTHWSVGDEPAFAFVEALYEAFKRRRRVLLVDAVREARQKARKTDATWIAYVVYGHPNASVIVE